MNPPLQGPGVDLEHNRRGMLSPAQAAVVASTDYASMLLTIVALFIAVNALGVVALVGYLMGSVVGLVMFALTLLPCAALAFWGVKLARMFNEHRIKSRPVRAAQGHVVWGGSQWRTIEATPQGPRELAAVVLPPGAYRFYLCGEQIVGAESPLGAGGYSITQLFTQKSFWSGASGSTAMTPLPVGDARALLGALAQTVGFTEGDLDANRRGALSARQGGGAVVCVEGVAQHRWEMPTKFTVRQFLVIAGASVPIAAELGRVVVPGLTYRVYRAASDGRVVSIEPVG